MLPSSRAKAVWIAHPDTLPQIVSLSRSVGTGGSAGHAYLKKTAEKHSIFRDFANLSTYIIPRSSLPKLPQKLKKGLGFYFTYGK